MRCHRVQARFIVYKTENFPDSIPTCLSFQLVLLFDEFRFKLDRSEIGTLPVHEMDHARQCVLDFGGTEGIVDDEIAVLMEVFDVCLSYG